MFKFIHAADIHLDSPLQGLARYEGAPVDRIRGAAREAFKNLVALALDEKVDFVLIAGDVFDGDWKDYNTGLFFSAQLSRLRESDIKVFMISGNHDAASQVNRNLRVPENVHVFPDKKPATVYLEELDVAIHGQGFARRDITDNLASGYPCSREGSFNIGILHTCADGVEGHEPYAPCSMADLTGKGYDYWALGHIHKRMVLNKSPMVVFPGNIQGRNIRETGSKGCSLVTVSDEREIVVEERELDVLQWDVLNVDCSDARNGDVVLEKVRDVLIPRIKQCNGNPLAARVILSGKCDAHRALSSETDKWMNEIRALATDISNGDVWIEKVVFSTGLSIDIKKISEGQTPVGHFLRFVDSLPSDVDALATLTMEIETLKAKLPAELRQGEDAIDLGSREFMEKMIVKARDLLVPRLITTGGDL